MLANSQEKNALLPSIQRVVSNNRNSLSLWQDIQSLEFFRKISMRLNPQGIDRLLKNMELKKFSQANEMIYAQGETNCNFYVVIKGQVKLVQQEHITSAEIKTEMSVIDVTDPNISSYPQTSKEVVFKTIYPGFYFGEHELVYPLARQMSALCVSSDTVVGVFSPNGFSKVIQDYVTEMNPFFNQASSLLSMVPKECKIKLAYSCRSREMALNEIVYKQGSKIESIHFLSRGSIQLHSNERKVIESLPLSVSQNFTEAVSVICSISTPSFFGDEDLLDWKGTRKYTALVTSNSALIHSVSVNLFVHGMHEAFGHSKAHQKLKVYLETRRKWREEQLENSRSIKQRFAELSPKKINCNLMSIIKSQVIDVQSVGASDQDFETSASQLSESRSQRIKASPLHTQRDRSNPDVFYVSNFATETDMTSNRNHLRVKPTRLHKHQAIEKIHNQEVISLPLKQNRSVNDKRNESVFECTEIAEVSIESNINESTLKAKNEAAKSSCVYDPFNEQWVDRKERTIKQEGSDTKIESHQIGDNKVAPYMGRIQSNQSGGKQLAPLIFKMPRKNSNDSQVLIQRSESRSNLDIKMRSVNSFRVDRSQSFSHRIKIYPKSQQKQVDSIAITMNNNSNPLNPVGEIVSQDGKLKKNVHSSVSPEINRGKNEDDTLLKYGTDRKGQLVQKEMKKSSVEHLSREVQNESAKRLNSFLTQMCNGNEIFELDSKNAIQNKKKILENWQSINNTIALNCIDINEEIKNDVKYTYMLRGLTKEVVPSGCQGMKREKRDQLYSIFEKTTRRELQAAAAAGQGVPINQNHNNMLMREQHVVQQNLQRKEELLAEKIQRQDMSELDQLWRLKRRNQSESKMNRIDQKRSSISSLSQIPQQSQSQISNNFNMILKRRLHLPTKDSSQIQSQNAFNKKGKLFFALI